jgi:excisionase family DNA binding protein
MTASPQPGRLAPPRLLSVTAVAERLDLSTKTIRRCITAGTLPVHRLGRQLRVSEADLLAFLQQRRE